jgi:galactose mutarotase-like enzyme
MSYETLENNFLILNVKHHGAELSSVIDKITGFEYIWQAGESWKRHAPVLFPIIGRLIDNKYSFKQNIYNLNQHGFARDLPYTLISKTTNKLTFNLKSNVDTLKNYPFSFSLEISYELIDNKLTVNYNIYNSGNNNLYFSIGAHPAFNTNFNNGNLNDYSLKFSVDELITQPLENGLRNEKRNRIQLNEKALKLDKNLFKNDAIILGNNQINDIELIHQSQNHSVKLTCTNWPYFGIWTKENSKDFICLEPWYGITDHHQHNQILEEKEGILALESGHTFECAYCITFKTNN